MELKKLLDDYEIGGIGDIKKTYPPFPFVQNWNRGGYVDDICGIYLGAVSRHL